MTKINSIAMQGACHCKEVAWTYSLPLESVTACNCTLCRRYGALWAYGNLGQGVTISGRTKAYSHGKQINGFHFCENCGCLAYYLAKKADSDGLLRIAINMRTINNVEQIAHVPIDHFDGFDTFDDLPRDHRTVKDLWF